ncbi:MAG: tyrosine-type recombinase/integrase [Paludibacteraceae bacterium]|nr:tyrosine-type recombinase/integrase [Paludibacteraceae bacterium]
MLTIQEFSPAELPYFPATLKHLPQAGWRIDYYAYNPVSGQKERVRMYLNDLKKRFRTTAEFRTYANKMVCAINAKLFSGWTPFMETQSVRHYETIKDVMDKYIKEKERDKLSPSSLQNYRSVNSMILRWLKLKKFENLEMKNFTKSLAIQFMDYIYNEHTFTTPKEGSAKRRGKALHTEEKHIGANRYNNILKQCRAFFSWALQKEYCPVNPFADLKLKKKEEKKRTLATAEDRAKIRKYFMENCPQYMIVAELVFNALIRPVEITRIKVGQVDLMNKVIHLDAGQTKNGYARDAVLSDELIQILADTLAPGYPSNHYLIGPGFLPGVASISTKAFNKKWLKMREATGIDKTIQLYSLRDGGLTGLFDNGLDAKTVMKAADHHDLNITTRYIGKHADPELVDKVRKATPTF